MNKNINLKQSMIPTNEVLEGTENYLSYCLLAAYILLFLLLIMRVFKDDYETLFLFVFISSCFVVAGNIYSFNTIEKKLKKTAANCKIIQLTNIIDSEPQNADAYFHRGRVKREINEYLSALRDFNRAQKLENNLSDYLKQTLSSDIKHCEEKLNKKLKNRKNNGSRKMLLL